MKTWPLIAVLSLAFLAGCDKDNGTGPATPTDPQGWIDLAWSQYEVGDYLSMAGSNGSLWQGYQMALADSLAAYQDSVNAAQNHDPIARQEAVARLGMARVQLLQLFSCGGWVSLKLGDPSEANGNFMAATGLVADYREALAGHAFTMQALRNWVQSNEKVTAALALDSTWTFTHDTQINYLDLRLLRVQNYFNLGQFEASLNEALALNAIVDPSSQLRDDDFNLATVEGYTKLQELIFTLDDLI